MRTRPQRIALSRVVNTVITKTATVQPVAPVIIAHSDSPVEEEINPWVGKTIRIGYGQFLGQIPICDKIKEAAQESDLPVTITCRSSDEISKMYFNEEIDVALLSLVEFFQRPESFISSDVCVCSEGLVRSVLLYGRVLQPYQIKTIVMDTPSPTCEVMVKILLAERYGIHPEVTVLKKNERWETSTADAVVLIGDRALRQPPRGETFSFIWDLGQRWSQWTGVPFIYHFWLSRDKQLGKYIAPVLASARDKGVELLPELALREARRLKLSPEFCTDYLIKKLAYRLGGRQRKAVEIFCRLAKKHSLIDIGSPIPFNNHFRFRRYEFEQSQMTRETVNNETRD